MPPRLLTKNRFTEADLGLAEVQNFTCGQERWNVEVATWIKSSSGANSVLEDIRDRGVEVWLFRTEEGELVGFSSLGENTWSFPLPKGPKHRISYIPFIGVHERFQGEPADADRDDKFAYQILDDLIEYAAAKTAKAQERLHHVIGLSVDEDNTRAIRFYANRGFVDAKSPRKDKSTGVTYMRMFLNIEALVKEPLPPA
jgi:ribosomal protein S18 acetylase RimI-like enzyme